MDRKISGNARLETAAATWEAVLDILDSGAGQKGLRAQAQRCRDRLGTAQLRYQVVGWVDAIEADWLTADGSPESDQYGEAFDWDFIPDWIALNVDWSSGTPHVRSPRTIPGSN